MILLDQNEAAKIIGVKPFTLRQWRHYGKGPRFYKLSNKAVRYDKADLLAWIEAKKVEPGNKREGKK